MRLKRCTFCRQNKPIDAYYTRHGKPRARCKRCYTQADATFRTRRNTEDTAPGYTGMSPLAQKFYLRRAPIWIDP